MLREGGRLRYHHDPNRASAWRRDAALNHQLGVVHSAPHIEPGSGYVRRRAQPDLRIRAPSRTVSLEYRQDIVDGHRGHVRTRDGARTADMRRDHDVA